MSSYASSKNNDTITIYNNIKEYKEMMSPDDLNYCKEYIEHMPFDKLSNKAKEIIGQFNYPCFYHERKVCGECDEEGPVEHFWTLYIITDNFNEGYKYHKFYREVHELQGDIYNELNYKIASLTEEENKILDYANSQPYELYNVVYNDSKYISKQADATIMTIKEEIIFVNESCEWGECDDNGPREEFYTLYIFTRNQDGTINHRKYYREVYLEDDKEKVIYDEIKLCHADYEKKFIL